MNRIVFSSVSVEWQTPRAVMQMLEAEFGRFDFDPCPVGGVDGLEADWGTGLVFVNPPFKKPSGGSWVGAWVAKAWESAQAGATVVMLLPAKTDVRWWHDYVLPHSNDIRFIRGRLKFSEYTTGAPFPSCIVVFKLEA